MADGTSKAKKNKQGEGVLAGLPSTRPSRMSRRARSGGPSVEATRAAAARAADTREATGSRASGKRTTAADKTRKATATAKTAKPKAAAAKTTKPKAAAAKPKPAAPKKAGPARPAPPPANVAPISEVPRPGRKPRAVRAATPALKELTEQAEARREDVPVARPAQSGPELVSTVVQAAGELASIGVTLGGQILKRAASKLPRP